MAGTEPEEKRASGRRIVTIVLLRAMAVVALERTVVSTAMPSIIAQLKGMDIDPWVFSACLLSESFHRGDLAGRRIGRCR